MPMSIPAATSMYFSKIMPKTIVMKNVKNPTIMLIIRNVCPLVPSKFL